MNELTNFSGKVVKPDAAFDSSDSSDAFVALVGSRVRKARERKGLARRVLSELSGVSQRYLAQLENGGGNISISLLKRVADALDHRIEWLVGDEDPWNSEASMIAEHLPVCAFRSTPESDGYSQSCNAGPASQSTYLPCWFARCG